MVKESAGLLMYKVVDHKLKVFIVHPGGPIWKDKDEGCWSVPKGEISEKDNGNFFQTAIREMKEETGIDAKDHDFIELGFIVQKSGKKVHCWAFEGDWSGLLMCSSYAHIEWPYRSGKKIAIPEVDKAGFFDSSIAKNKVNPAQAELIVRLEKLIINQYSLELPSL